MKNTKSETLNSKQYRNPNAQNRKEEKGLGHLKFGNLNLFRGSGVRDARVRELALRPLRTGVKFLAPRALPARNHSHIK